MLEEYVHKPDPNFRYRLVNKVRGEGFTVFVLDMTSQQWRTSAEVDCPVWRHWLMIVKPDQVQGTAGMLFISGGSNGKPAPATADAVFAGLAIGTRTVVAELRMVPNQPLTFADDPVPRREDAIIAYTWDKFLKTGDETWPLRLPMTKAAVCAMDVMTTFCAELETGKAIVDRFVLIGGSKRGWAAWTTAAVDGRVIAVVPASIDVLNVEQSLEHHFRAYGFWAPALKDYTDMGIMDWSGTPQFRALMEIEDPFSYRDRLTMPKFVVNSTGDQYFLPDSSQFYFPDLRGEKYLRYVPNTRHDLENSDAYPSMIAFYESIITGSPRPKFDCKSETDGSIVVASADRPAEVSLWQATNPVARDFRLDTLGPAWTSSPVEPVSDGIYVGSVQKPAKGWTAYFVEMTYPSRGKFPFKFTSGVRVVPDILPFPAPEKQ
jgi:PhoPQ-activated pathogenicity-related protein